MKKKPYLLLITGLPAVGKSGFAAYAGRVLGWPVLEKDHYKEILFDDIGFRSREEKLKLGIAAMDLMYDSAGTLLKLGRSVILDNNFENSSLEGLRRLVRRCPCEMITVRFEAEMEAVYQRFIRRDRNPNRHPGHVLNSAYPPQGQEEAYEPISLEEFSRRYRERGMTDFNPGGKLLRVDVSSFEGYSNAAVMKKLRALL